MIMKMNFMLVLLIVLFGTVNCRAVTEDDIPNLAEEEKPEEAIKAYLKKVDDYIGELLDDVSDSIYKVEKDYVSDVLRIVEVTTQIKVVSQHVKKFLKEIPIDKIQDEDTLRQIKINSDWGVSVLTEYDLSLYRNFSNTMETLQIKPKLCTWTDDDCTASYVPTIIDEIRHETNLDIVKFYWELWREFTKSDGKFAFWHWVKLYEKTAKLNNFESPHDHWYFYYENVNFLDDIKDVMEELRPLYAEFHAYLRHVLHQKFGEDVVSANKPIPHYLFEQVMLQDASSNHTFQLPYPDSPLPDMQFYIDKYRDGLEIVAEADRFFRSMKMGVLPRTFWQKNVRELEAAEYEESMCESNIRSTRSKVMLLYCPQISYEKFLEMHKTMAKVRANILRKKQIFSFADESCPGADDAIGEAVMLSVSSMKHLKRIDLLSEFKYNDEIALNRLFKKGFHLLFTLPMNFVHEILFVNILKGEVTEETFNCAYWDLMNKYLGVAPHKVRTNKEFDVSYDFFTGLDDNSRFTRTIVQKTLGYKLYMALCEKTGQYQVGGKHPLDNCNFAKKKSAGFEIQRLLAAGTKYNWQDIYEPIVGTRKLSASGILEYYKPLYLWLQEENKKNKVPVGWDHDTQCE